MLEEFLYEIIILIAFLILFVIYLILRKKQSDMRDVNNSLGADANDKTKLQQIDPSHKEKPTLLDRNFGRKKGEGPKKSKRKKCEVPKHDKIVKENFREFKGVKLLVVEDNAINQRVISGLLSTSGIEITMADDGLIALDILEENNGFDIILMDVHMPNMDGYEATKRIRTNARYDHIVVVALSGDTGPDDTAKMEAAGMEEHLEKPLRMDAFYDILYAYTKAQSDENEFVEVVMTKELHGDKGLAVCGGDDAFYKKILGEFVKNYSDSYDTIHRHLDNNEFEQADALLLDLLGITANIGADNINRIILELKESIKDTRERSYFTTLDEYDAHLQILLNDIKSYLNS